jgi:hypothetical protein
MRLQRLVVVMLVVPAKAPFVHAQSIVETPCAASPNAVGVHPTPTVVRLIEWRDSFGDWRRRREELSPISRAKCAIDWPPYPAGIG